VALDTEIGEETWRPTQRWVAGIVALDTGIASQVLIDKEDTSAKILL
jgi:hypothetical protein